MCKKYWIIVIENDDDVDKAMRIASNCGLYAQYKIGVYGKEKQNEIFLVGSWFNYMKAKKEIRKAFDK